MINQTKRTARYHLLAVCFLFGTAYLWIATAASVMAAAPFFFIQLIDPQLGMFADNRDFAQETANLEFAVATINWLHPAFVVVTGDLVNQTGDPAQIQEYKRLLGQIESSIPVYNVASNHDVGNVPTPESEAAYTNEFGPDYYSFRYGDFVGIVLVSNLIKTPQNVRALCDRQKHWLETALKQAPATSWSLSITPGA